MTIKPNANRWHICEELTMPPPHTITTALKEWAVTIDALGKGRQIILMRKGGIREEARRFEVSHPYFLLYPTYEHQSPEQLKQEAWPTLDALLSAPRPEESVTFSYWARLHEVVELTEDGPLEALLPHHIWANDYPQKRLHWQPRNPLAVMLLRVYRLERPETIPYIASYGGCKSWVELAEPVLLDSIAPVLSDQRFQQTLMAIKTATRGIGAL